jgi:CMP-N,N'-diacetyllegionaminic acid synthase
MERMVKTRIATICARGGSKGLPGKNVRLLAGKPLIAHAIDQAKEAGLFDIVVVSSDSDAILDEAAKWSPDLTVKRPDHMATDAASKLPPIAHAVLAAEAEHDITFDTIVDLDVTSPLRAVEDIIGAVKLMEERNVSNVLTGSPARKIPYFNMLELTPEGYVALSKPTEPRIERRQDCPPCFDMNAAVYVWQRFAIIDLPHIFFDDTLLYIMPEERSFDIDNETDFEFVAFLMEKRAAADRRS